jgi:hypothetical protein
VEQDGKTVPLRDVPFVKDTPDLVTFAKRGFEAHREIGSRIPVKVSKPEEVQAWRKEHLPKLYTAGILEAPPGKPEEYGIAKPEKIPDGFGWNDELSKELATTLHKHGAPKGLAAELLGLYEKALLGAEQTLKTSYDEGMAALKKEHGDKFEERMELGKRLTKAIFKTPEELEFFERTGMGDHPAFLSVVMRLAPLAQQDSAFLKEVSRPAGGMTGDEVRAELGRIMSDKTHPKFAGYWRQDKDVMAYVEDLYKKAYGEGKVELGGGIEVAARP